MISIPSRTAMQAFIDVGNRQAEAIIKALKALEPRKVATIAGVDVIADPLLPPGTVVLRAKAGEPATCWVAKGRCVGLRLR